MMGIHDEPYWRYAAVGELRLQRCTGCDEFRYPPGPVCPDCLEPEHEWVALSGHGELVAWTVFHRKYFPELPVPYTVAVVRSAEGPFLVGNLVGAQPRELRHDQPLRAVFEDVLEPERSWRICQWTPGHDEERA
jgi:uncharacterized OB-fold protein